MTTKYLVYYLTLCILCTILVDSCLMKVRPDTRSGSSSKRTSYSSSSTTTVKCGKIPSVPSTFYRTGVEANYFEFPWLASIQKKRQEYFEPRCAGSIISYKYILTSASCFYNLAAGSRMSKKDIRTLMRVVVGTATLNSSSVNQGAQFCKIKHTWIPKKFNVIDFSHKYDIAVVKLRRALNNYGSSIYPICLPHQMNKHSRKIIISGWGDKLSPSGPKLYKLMLHISRNKDCENRLKHLHVKLNHLQLCSMSGNKGTCIEDVGGPGMQVREGHMYLIGIVSYHSICRGGVFIYTNVKRYTKWIEKVMQKMENGRAPPRRPDDDG